MKGENVRRGYEETERQDTRPSTAAAHDLRRDEVPDDLRIFQGDGMESGEHLLDGGSAIIGPDGNYLAGPAGTEEVILYADLDTGRIAAEHQTFEFVGHYSRPDVSDLTVNTAPRGHPGAA